jgi:pimeloyl-ACP methyl ester carboxylesterase
VSDRPPVVLVHGFAGSTERTWRPSGWLDLLADMGRSVVGIDLRYDALETETRAALPDGACDAVGFSLGARVLLTLASQTPERFRRLVVSGVGENLLRDEPGEAMGFARYFEAQGGTGDAGADHDAMIDAVRTEISTPLTPEQLGRVTVPVLVVLGDRDFAGPAEPLVDALPDARLVTLPGVDHFATPKAFGFLDAALDFLDA